MSGTVHTPGLRLGKLAVEQGDEVEAQPELKLNVQNLSVYYRAFRALRDITLPVYENRITAIIGPSGSGKSTFLRTLNRMHELNADVRVSGSATLDGRDIFADYDVVDLRKRVGMIFQRPNPFHKSIYDNVAYGPRMRGLKDRARLDEIVERCLRQAALWDEVRNILKKPGTSLSGGQQQRLCIARAIAVEPEVILMDEPASALDPISTVKIEELMMQLREKYTIVIVTHNMAQASRASDYTAVFIMADDRAGELVEFGTTAQIFTTPNQKRTEDYVSGRFG